MKDRQWVAFFSQTGTEILRIAEILGRWPDRIITNKRPDDKRTINPELIENFPGRIRELSNRPTDGEYSEAFIGIHDPVVTLHGWLRIMPPWMCSVYDMFNGHPGLITKYPELKGKDPQIRAYEGGYEWIGCVLHRVTDGVDEGEIILSSSIRNNGYDLDYIYRILANTSVGQWITLLDPKLEL